MQDWHENRQTAAQLRDAANAMDALVWSTKDIANDKMLLTVIGNFLIGRSDIDPDDLERMAQRLSRAADEARR